jgi:hypothetical protein
VTSGERALEPENHAVQEAEFAREPREFIDEN